MKLPTINFGNLKPPNINLKRFKLPQIVLDRLNLSGLNLDKWTDKVTEKFSALTLREKRMVGGLGGLLIVFLFYLIVVGIGSYESGLAKRVADIKAKFQKVELVTTELARLKKRPTSIKRNQPLIGYIEQIAGTIRLKDRIQLNLIPQEKQDIEAVEIKVDQLTLDEMMGLIYALENSKPKMVIDHMELNHSFKGRDLLRIRLRVLAQKAGK